MTISFKENSCRTRRSGTIAAMFAAAVVGCTTPLVAQAEGWEYSLSPYLWLPRVALDSSDIGDGGEPGEGSDLEVGPVDYLDALDFAVMVAGDARNENWAVLADLLYVDFGIDDRDIDIGRPGNEPDIGSYSAGLSGSIVALSVGRSFRHSEGSYVDGLIGWRQFNLTLDLAGDPDNAEAFYLTNDLDVNDMFIAINGRYRMGQSQRWSLRYYADLGAGESELTWQARLGMGYDYDWGELFVDFRHLDYDFGSNDELEDVTSFLSGPVLGATFRFGGPG